MRQVVIHRSWTVEGLTGGIASIEKMLAEQHHLAPEITQGPNRVRLKGGSMFLFRFVGGALSPDRILPKRVYARIDHGAEVNLTLESVAGWGYMDPPTRRRYERILNMIADDVESTLRLNAQTVRPFPDTRPAQ